MQLRRIITTPRIPRKQVDQSKNGERPTRRLGERVDKFIERTAILFALRRVVPSARNSNESLRPSRALE